MERSPINNFEVNLVKINAKNKLVSKKYTQNEKVYTVDTSVQCTSVHETEEVIFGQNEVNFVKTLQRKRVWEEGKGEHVNGKNTQTGIQEVQRHKKSECKRIESVNKAGKMIGKKFFK